VFGQGGKGIMRVSPNGGAPELIVTVNDGEEAHGPQLLPGGQHVIFTLAAGTALQRWDSARIVVQSLKSGERKILVEGGSDARYVSTGHLVYAVSGSLFARPFDVRRLEVMGDATPVVTGVSRSVGGVTGVAHFSVSSAGSLVYVPGPVAAWSPRLDLALIDRKGKVERLNLPAGGYLSPRASPDGTRIVFGTDDGKEAIVWTYKLSGSSAMQRLTIGGNNRFPIWSPDGKRIVFQSDRDGDRALFWQPADGTGRAERLTTPNEGEAHVPESWSPTADSLLLTVVKGADMSLWTFSLQDRRATPFGDVHSSDPTGAVFSPDGRWVAYTSTERGRTTIYVQPFPSTGAKYPLFAKGFDTPHAVTWSPDGRELFFNPRPGGFEAVSVTTEPTFAFGKPVALPRPFRLSQPAARRSYDITRNGKFLGQIESEQAESSVATAPQINVVLNWFEELRARVPVTK
jgi:eukaryotic-like serine/threonine-protein kinase